MGWPPLVVERVVGEPLLHEIDQVAGSSSGLAEPDATWVTSMAAVGGRSRRRRRRRWRPTTRSTGMTSTTPSGTPGNSIEQAPGVGEDHRLGHAEATDPARPGLGQGGLDDRGPHDADRQVAPGLLQGLLAQRLGVGVGVGPAQGGGPGPAGLGHPVGDPALAELLGLVGQEGHAGGAQLVAGPWPGTRRGARGGGSRPRRRARDRRAASTSRRQSTSMKKGLSDTSSSGAEPRRLPAT